MSKKHQKDKVAKKRKGKFLSQGDMPCGYSLVSDKQLKYLEEFEELPDSYNWGIGLIFLALGLWIDTLTSTIENQWCFIIKLTIAAACLIIGFTLYIQHRKSSKKRKELFKRIRKNQDDQIEPQF